MTDQAFFLTPRSNAQKCCIIFCDTPFSGRWYLIEPHLMSVFLLLHWKKNTSKSKKQPTIFQICPLPLISPPPKKNLEVYTVSTEKSTGHSSIFVGTGTGGSCGDRQVNAWWSWPASWIVARNVASLQRRILNYPCAWPCGCRWGYLDWWNPSNMEELGMVNVGGDDDFLRRELRLSSFWILNEMIIDVGRLVVVGRWVVTGHMYCDGGMCDLSRRCGLFSNVLAILMHLESNHHQWNLSSVCSMSTNTPVLSELDDRFSQYHIYSTSILHLWRSPSHCLQ